jgi:ABC-type phosphate/phosphonate transport system substrate-binding protein
MFDNIGATTRRQFSVWLAGLAAAALLPKPGSGQNPGRLLRVAVSVETLAGANVNDARAAYRVWSREVTSSLGITSVELVPDIFLPSEQIIRLIRQGAVDMFGITAWEYAKVVEFVDAESVLVEDYVANGMEYVLLVHNASPFKNLGDLRGGSLTTHRHRDMNLVPAWIGNLLAAENLPRMELFFGDQLVRDSVTQIVLPVFFRRVDVACLARRHYEAAVELNPQLGKDLHALAISPKVVPIALCFQKNCSAESRRGLTETIARAETLPAGQQIVALYQSRRMVPRPVSCMNATLDLLHRYAQVVGRSAGQRKDHS